MTQTLQTVKDALTATMPKFAAVLPKHLTPERLFQVSVTTIGGDELLLQCSLVSTLSCVMSAAELGLEPGGPKKESYLIPRRNKKTGGYMCTLIVGYPGLLKLIYQSGEVKSLRCREVCERDGFEYEEGLTPILKHKPAIFHPEGRGRMIAVYSIADMKDEASRFELMTRDECERIRDRDGAPSDNSPWRSDPIEMCKKTVLRRFAKMLPRSIVAVMDDAERVREDEPLAMAAAPAVQQLPSVSPHRSLAAAVAGKLPQRATPPLEDEDIPFGAPPPADEDGEVAT
jgi:recombination protein RecT